MIGMPERSTERDAAIKATLPHVPFDGWTFKAVRAGLADLGKPAELAGNLFPDGPVGLLEAWSDLEDREMEAASSEIAEIGLGRRVRALVAFRLRRLRPHREAARRALAVLARSGEAGAAVRITARTVDAIWHAAGDRAADFSWYTKRATLAGIYSTTLLYWLNDQSEDDEATLRFLDRRLAGLKAVGELGRRLRGRDKERSGNGTSAPPPEDAP